MKATITKYAIREIASGLYYMRAANVGEATATSDPTKARWFHSRADAQAKMRSNRDSGKAEVVEVEIEASVLDEMTRQAINCIRPHDKSDDAAAHREREWQNAMGQS